MIPSPPRNDYTLSVNSFNTEFSSVTSSVTPSYHPSSDFDHLALFPDLPTSSCEEISGQTPYTYIEDVGENASLVPGDLNEFNTNFLPLTGSVSLNTISTLNQSFSSSHYYLFPPVEQVRGQQEWQPSQQGEQQNNENDINFQFNQHPSSAETFHDVYSLSPISAITSHLAETPDLDQIVFPESSKSAPLFRESPPISNTRNRSKAQQKKVGGLFCLICDKSLGRPQDLKRHLAIHTGVKNFKCSECGYLFQRKDALDRHHKTLAGRCRERRPLSCRPNME